MHFPSYLFNEKIPAEIAGNGISEPLNKKKKHFGGACPLRRSRLSFLAYTFKISSYDHGNMQMFMLLLIKKLMQKHEG